MDITLNSAIRSLGPNFAMRVMRELRPTQNYTFSRLLPDVESDSYTVENGSLTMRVVMAGLVGMDSPYPEGGVMELSTFLERAAKVALALDLPEGSIRQLQALALRLAASGANSTQALADNILNFTVSLAQSQLDTAEWMRGQVFAKGVIDWTFNGIRLQVDYGIPAANKLATRTGTNAYGGTTSQFWADVRAMQLALGTIDYLFVSQATYLKIVSNAANNIMVSAETPTTRTIRRLTTQAQPTGDARDTITFVVIDQSGEVIRQATTAGQPAETVKVPFFADNVMTAVGAPKVNTWTALSGSTPILTAESLGYMHLAPTVEGGGAPGRWARVYVPEHRPWALRGETACNELPVLFDPARVVIGATE